MSFINKLHLAHDPHVGKPLPHPISNSVFGGNI